MWYPSDPPEKRWTIDKGLLALIDTALVHLFKERYAVDHPEEPWLGQRYHTPPVPQRWKLDTALSCGRHLRRRR